MARAKINDTKVIEVYNSEGKEKTIIYLKEVCKAVYPTNALNRIKKDPRYCYSQKNDRFNYEQKEPVFMALDELCNNSCDEKDYEQHQNFSGKPVKAQDQLETLFYEMAMDRLLELAEFITISHRNRIVQVHKTALNTAGYSVEVC